MPLPDELKQLAERVSNRGRWGDDDQRGTLNFITPDAVRRGVAAVKRGVSFSLSIPFDEDGPQTGVIPGRINKIQGILSTETHVAFRTYSQHDLEAAFALGVAEA